MHKMYGTARNHKRGRVRVLQGSKFRPSKRRSTRLRVSRSSRRLWYARSEWAMEVDGGVFFLARSRNFGVTSALSWCVSRHRRAGLGRFPIDPSGCACRGRDLRRPAAAVFCVCFYLSRWLVGELFRVRFWTGDELFLCSEGISIMGRFFRFWEKSRFIVCTTMSNVHRVDLSAFEYDQAVKFIATLLI